MAAQRLHHATRLLCVLLAVWAGWQMAVSIGRPVVPPGFEPQPLNHRIDINAANASQLVLLPGVGPATAQRIVDYRMEKGPFTRYEHLERVKMIGPATRARLERWITLGDGEAGAADGR